MRQTLAVVLLLTMVFAGPPAQAQPSCELTPLTLPLFNGTPVAQLATAEATPATDVLTENEVVEILEMYVACTNTGDPTLVWAMFTPRWFSTEFADSEEHYLPAFEYEIANSQEMVENPLDLVGVEEIEMHIDGRVVVTATFESGNTQWTDRLILANVDGQWLIDEVVLVSPSD